MFFRKRHKDTILPAMVNTPDMQDNKILYSTNGDAVCSFSIQGNATEDVELCITHGEFGPEDPRVTAMNYGQILSCYDMPKVRVLCNKPIQETIETYLNSVIHSIIVTSAMADLKSLDLKLKLSLWQRPDAIIANHMGGTDIISVIKIGRFLNESTAVIDLSECPIDAVEHRRELFTSINVPKGSFFTITFVGLTPKIAEVAYHIKHIVNHQ